MIAFVLIGALATCAEGGGAVPAHDHRLRWSSTQALACPNRADLRTALRDRLEAAAVSEGPAAGDDIGLTIGGTDRALELTLRDGTTGEVTRRTIERVQRGERGSATCPDLAATVALLTEAWLVQLPWRGEGVVRSSGAPAGADTAPHSAAVTPPTPVRPAPDAGNASKANTQAPLVALPATPTDSAPAVAAPTARRWKLALRAAGGALLYPGDDTSGGAVGLFAIEALVPHRLGFGVEGAVNSDLTIHGVEDPNAQFTLHTLRFSAFASYRAFEWLAVAAGGELVRFGENTTNTGTASTVSQTLYTGAGWLAAIGSWSLLGPLRFFGEGRITVEPQEPFTEPVLHQPEHVLLTLSPIVLQLAAGLELRL